MITPISKFINYYTAFRSLPKYHLLYFLVRSSDKPGSGVITIKIEELIKACDRTRPTVMRWLKECCKAGYFRYVDWLDRHTLIIYYTNLDDFALSQGIDDIGESTEVPLTTFRSALHVWVSEVRAMNLQDQSVYRMHKEQKRKQKTNQPRVNTPADIFEKKHNEIHTSDYLQALSNNEGVGRTGTSLVHLGDRCAFVSPDFTLFGGSQDEIARRTGVTPRTIQRHLGDAYRLKKGLEVINKYQLAVAVGNSSSRRTLTKSKQIIDVNYDYFNRLFKVGRGETAIEFLATCNVYKSDVNYRYSDRRVNRIKNKAMKIVNIPILKSISLSRYTKSCI